MTMDLRDVKFKPLPPKKEGRHRFIAIVSYILSDNAIRGGFDGTDPAYFDAENMWDVSFGCIDCEQPWTRDMKRYCSGVTYEG